MSKLSRDEFQAKLDEIFVLENRQYELEQNGDAAELAKVNQQPAA